MSTAAENYHKDRVARLKCVICARFENLGLPTCVHHVAEGSGKRSDFSVAPLCSDATGAQGHHIGTFGFHASPKARYRSRMAFSASKDSGKSCIS